MKIIIVPTINTIEIANCETTNILLKSELFAPDFNSPLRTFTGTNFERKTAGYVPAINPVNKVIVNNPTINSTFVNTLKDRFLAITLCRRGLMA